MNTDRGRWHRAARRLALFTIAYNLVEGLVSMAFGWKDDSLSLFGFGADSFIEVGSALVVLWRLGGGEDRIRERRATMGIGALFLLLGAGVVLGALAQLGTRRHPPTTVPGALIALASLSFMAFLWRAKLRVGRQLDSATVMADAACSRACLQLSAVLLAGSLLFWAVPAWWWVDGVAALVLALLIGKEGLGMILAARRPDFHGGCGCD